MIRAQRFAVSRPMYAFDPTTWCEATPGYQVDAVWFKRKDGVLSAVRGTYHPLVIPFSNQPDTDRYEDWVAAANDNRYGGSWAAKWNGTGLLCYDTPTPPDVARAHIQFLDTALKNFPTVPAGYDGWFTFPKEGTR